jgi:DNA-binding MarR family transcriptional regulator
MKTRTWLTTSRRELLVGRSDRDFRTLISGLFGVVAHLQAISDRLGDIGGLRGAQHRILMAVLSFDETGGVTVGELARTLHLRPNYVTGELRELEERRLIERREHPDDGRSVLVVLTAAGRGVLAEVVPLVRAANDAIFRTFTRADFTTLRGLLDELLVTLPDALAVLEATPRPATAKRTRGKARPRTPA